MQGLVEARTAVQKAEETVSDVLARVRGGTRVTVRCKGLNFYGERVASKTPKRVVFSSDCTLHQDDGEWFFTEKSRGSVLQVLAVQLA